MSRFGGRRFALVALAGAVALGLMPVGDTGAQALPPFKLTSIGLFQPDDVLNVRLGGDVDELADYSRALIAAAEATFGAAKRGAGATGAITVALRPGRRSKVWLALGDNRIDDAVRQELIRNLEAIPPIEVHGGPLAFNLNFEAWGGGTPVTTPDAPLALPPEWRNAKVVGEMPDVVLDAVWPDRR